jgi:hypothetical protein
LGAPSTQAHATLGDEHVRLGQVQYAYKPSRTDNGFNRKEHQRTVVLPCAAWTGREFPTYVVVAHGEDPWQDGATVLRWKPRTLSVVDDPDFEGLAVGRLRVTPVPGGAPEYRIDLTLGSAQPA